MVRFAHTSMSWRESPFISRGGGAHLLYTHMHAYTHTRAYTELRLQRGTWTKIGGRERVVCLTGMKEGWVEERREGKAGRFSDAVCGFSHLNIHY